MYVEIKKYTIGIDLGGTNTKIALAGAFRPDFAAANIVADQIDWSKGSVPVTVKR